MELTEDIILSMGFKKQDFTKNGGGIYYLFKIEYRDEYLQIGKNMGIGKYCGRFPETVEELVNIIIKFININSEKNGREQIRESFRNLMDSE